MFTCSDGLCGLHTDFPARNQHRYVSFYYFHPNHHLRQTWQDHHWLLLLCFFTCHLTFLVFFFYRAHFVFFAHLLELPTRNQQICIFCFCVLELSGQNCSHPIIPEHGGFYCKPSPCRGFPPKSRIYYFCESGYVLPNRVHHSTCRKGRWDPSIPTCTPNSGKTKWLHLLF